MSSYPTPANRQYLKGVAAKVDAVLNAGGEVLVMLVELGLVESENETQEQVIIAPPQPLRPTAAAVASTPSFSAFAEQWFGEFKVG